MKVLTLSDTHNYHGFIPEEDLTPADMIICAGDISKRGVKSEIENFLYWYNKLSYEYKILIAGNHDFYFENNKPAVNNLLEKFPGIVYLENEGITIEGINIWGSPVQPEFCNWAFNVKRGKDIKHYWDMILDNTDILITHGPPHKILDKTARGDFAGCEELAKRIEIIRPRFNIFGHIHEAYGILKKEHTTFINAAVVDQNYNPTNKPISFEIFAKEKI